MRLRISIRGLVCWLVGQSIRLLVRWSIRRSVRWSVCPSVRLSVCPSVRLSVSPSLRLSVCLPVCLSVCPSVCLHILYQLTLNHSSRLKSFTMSSSQPQVWIIFPPSIFPLVFNQRQFMWWGGPKYRMSVCACVFVRLSVCPFVSLSVRRKKIMLWEKFCWEKKLSCEWNLPSEKIILWKKLSSEKKLFSEKKVSSEKLSSEKRVI